MDLKRCFTSAPMLIQPDLSCQFIVEVVATDMGVKATLSQQALSHQKFHPWASLAGCPPPYAIKTSEIGSCLQLSSPWRNGDIDWIGLSTPFIVWMDHKNLSYIQAAKCLNSCQVWWAQFFGHFNFNLTYRPGSRIIKPNALSTIHLRWCHYQPWHHPTLLLCGSGCYLEEQVQAQQIQVLARHVTCMYQSVSVLKSSSGCMILGLPVTLELVGHFSLLK